MKTERLTLMLIRGAIAELSEGDQAKVHVAVQEMREVIARHEGAGLMALALVGAEKAVEGDSK